MPQTRLGELEPYRKAGTALIPLRRWDEKNDKGRDIGKAPRDFGWRTKSYSFETCSAHMESGYNVGVPLQASDCILDVDPRHFPEGRDVLREFVERFKLDLDRYPCVLTGGGGQHYYMRKAPEMRMRVTTPDFPGIELKSAGTQIVAAGSVHPNGKLYHWDLFAPALADGVPEVPGAIVEFYQARETVESFHEPTGPKDALSAEEVNEWLNPEGALDRSSRFAGFVWALQDRNYTIEDAIALSVEHLDSLVGVHFGGSTKRVEVDVRRLWPKAQPRLSAEEAFPDDLPPEEDATTAPKAVPQIQAELLEKLNGYMVCVTKDGGYAIGREQPNPTFGYRETMFFNEGAIKKDLDRFRVPNVEKDKKTGAKSVKWRGQGSWWLEHPKRRFARHVVLDPDPSFKNDEAYNLYHGLSVAPDAAANWEPFRRLMHDVLCSGVTEHYEFLMNWVARLVQFPHLPGDVAIVFQGPPGMGKGTFGRALCELFAPYSVHISQPDQVTGKFNASLARAIVAFLDEALWAGSRTGESVLKAMVTERMFMCEPKGVDAFPVPNRLHITFSSNNDWVVPVGEDDRRYAVFQVTPENSGWFKALEGGFRVLHDGGPGTPVRKEILSGLLYAALHRDIEGWYPQQHIPETQARQDQRAETLLNKPREGWWDSVLQAGEFGSVTREKWLSEGIIVGPDDKEILARIFGQYAQSLPYRSQPYQSTGLGQWLKRRFGYNLDIFCPKIRRRCWGLPKLDQCRSDFVRILKIPPRMWD